MSQETTPPQPAESAEEQDELQQDELQLDELQLDDQQQDELHEESLHEDQEELDELDIQAEEIPVSARQKLRERLVKKRDVVGLFAWITEADLGCISLAHQFEDLRQLTHARAGRDAGQLAEEVLDHALGTISFFVLRLDLALVHQAKMAAINRRGAEAVKLPIDLLDSVLPRYADLVRSLVEIVRLRAATQRQQVLTRAKQAGLRQPRKRNVKQRKRAKAATVNGKAARNGTRTHDQPAANGVASSNGKPATRPGSRLAGLDTVLNGHGTMLPAGLAE